ncbi:hypothetical protein A374_15152 [Fictibacillus macauensis ZFHKF-1]|uniref:Uncharacterized protein n=1 Tax=Fictibacillus macauensis ZFHKF-1 TaxID=1196324 RepID=I8AGG8_9BACL|nr:hypothetical protein [Fictibacillus macauensis]EIT84474.1 hypothetical protein A374_15152 [Fictibacillus macauensis ZFHKF-1]
MKVSDFVIYGFVMIGAAIGLLFDHAMIGVLIGLGIGYVCRALILSDGKENTK